MSGDVVRILKELSKAGCHYIRTHTNRRTEKEKIRDDLQQRYDAGFRTLAICLTHSFTFPDHELQVADIAKEIGYEYISLSSQLLPMIKMVSRGQSSTADAYLTPHIKRYIEGFMSNFTNDIRNTRVEFMQSDGGKSTKSPFNLIITPNE